MERNALLKERLSNLVIDEDETLTTATCRLILEMEKNGESYRGIHADVCKEKNLNRNKYDRRMKKILKGYSGKEIKKNGRPKKLTKKEMKTIEEVCQKRNDTGNHLSMAELSDELIGICLPRFIRTGDDKLLSFSSTYMRKLLDHCNKEKSCKCSKT